MRIERATIQMICELKQDKLAPGARIKQTLTVPQTLVVAGETSVRMPSNAILGCCAPDNEGNLAACSVAGTLLLCQ